MTNRERFHTLMAGGKPDRVPFLVFSELLPGSIYADELKARGMGLIVHAGSVHMVREPSMTRIVYKENLKVEELHTPAGILTSRYRTDCLEISGSGEIQTEWYVKTEIVGCFRISSRCFPERHTRSIGCDRGVWFVLSPKDFRDARQVEISETHDRLRHTGCMAV